jgi:hypothetical protein
MIEAPGAVTIRLRLSSVRGDAKLAVAVIDFVGLRNAGRQPGASRLTASLTAAPAAEPRRHSSDSGSTVARVAVLPVQIRGAVASPPRSSDRPRSVFQQAAGLRARKPRSPDRRSRSTRTGVASPPWPCLQARGIPDAAARAAPRPSVGTDSRRRGARGRRSQTTSRDPLLEPLAASMPGDHDRAVSERPSDRPANQWMAGELAVPVPHRPLKRERQLITTAPPLLRVDELLAFKAANRDRSGCASSTGAPREPDDRDRRAATLELLPYSLPSRQLATPGTQPDRMRLRNLTTRRRVARVAGKRLACRTAPRPPSAGYMQTRRRPAIGAV